MELQRTKNRNLNNIFYINEGNNISDPSFAWAHQFSASDKNGTTDPVETITNVKVPNTNTNENYTESQEIAKIMSDKVKQSDLSEATTRYATSQANIIANNSNADPLTQAQQTSSVNLNTPDGGTGTTSAATPTETGMESGNNDKPKSELEKIKQQAEDANNRFMNGEITQEEYDKELKEIFKNDPYNKEKGIERVNKVEDGKSVSQDEVTAASAGDNTINRGDTLWKYATQTGTSVTTLALINGIENPDLIYAGDTIDFEINKEDVESASNSIQPLLDSLQALKDNFNVGEVHYNSGGFKADANGNSTRNIMNEIKSEIEHNEETVATDAVNYREWLNKIIESLNADAEQIYGVMGNTELLSINEIDG